MAFKSNLGNIFRNKFSEDIFVQKYRHEGCLTWEDLCDTLVEDVCRDKMVKDEKDQLKQFMKDGKFFPGGRYLYYAGRPRKFFNNCFLLKSEEDSREDWGELVRKATLCLATGGGIGNDYSILRPRGSVLRGTGGVASGPVSLMKIINEIGREIMQGGSRRSAIYASLNWKHQDINEFLHTKDWHDVTVSGTEGKSLAELKKSDFNFPTPLDMTNISVNYDTEWLLQYWRTGMLDRIFIENCRQALSTAEPGFSFNFFERQSETLRNACTEVTSSDDSDVCNLGSLNLGAINNLSEFGECSNLATKFLICGTLVADLPYDKIADIRQKNRRLGLGLMGIHEWLIQRDYRYEVTPELHRWLHIYRSVSRATADNFSSKLSISNPVACRAIAPTGSIGILAGTTTGIEPVYATAYKRRYLKGTKWHYQYVLDSSAKTFIEMYGVDPERVESALQLATDYERRIKFQADVQDYVDMGISSTINLPAWGTEFNNDSTVDKFGETLARYSHRLRGFTCYPDGARGGQPLVAVPYAEAIAKEGEVFEETHDVCALTSHGGVCGV